MSTPLLNYYLRGGEAGDAPLYTIIHPTPHYPPVRTRPRRGPCSHRAPRAPAPRAARSAGLQGVEACGGGVDVVSGVSEKGAELCCTSTALVCQERRGGARRRCGFASRTGAARALAGAGPSPSPTSCHAASPVRPGVRGASLCRCRGGAAVEVEVWFGAVAEARCDYCVAACMPHGVQGPASLPYTAVRRHAPKRTAARPPASPLPACTHRLRTAGGGRVSGGHFRQPLLDVLLGDDRARVLHLWSCLLSREHLEGVLCVRLGLAWGGAGGEGNVRVGVGWGGGELASCLHLWSSLLSAHHLNDGWG